MSFVIYIVTQNYYFFSTLLHKSTTLNHLRIILYSALIIMLSIQQTISAQGLWITGEQGAEDIQFLHEHDEGIVISGVFDQVVDGHISKGGTDVYILKIDSIGQTLWSTSIGSDGQDDILDSDLQQDGMVSLLIDCNGTSFISQDTLFRKNIDHQLSIQIDQNGIPKKVSSFYSPVMCSMEQQVHKEGHWFIIGSYLDSLFVNGLFVSYSSTIQTTLIQLDSNHQYLSSFPIQTGSQLTVKSMDADTSIVLFGEFTGSLSIGLDTFLANPIYTDLLLIELDPTNGIQYIEQIGGVYPNRVAHVSLKDSLIVVTGTFEGTIQMRDSMLSTSVLKEAGFMICLNKGGSIRWMKKIPSDLQVFVVHHIVSNGECIISGYYSGTLVDGSVQSQGGYDAFVASYSMENAAFNEIKTWGSNGNDRANRLEQSSEVDILCSGSFQGTLSSAYQSVTATDFSDGILSTFQRQTISINNIETESMYKLFPNPCIDEFFIDGPDEPFEWILFNHVGQFIKQGIKQDVYKVNLSSGLYWLQIRVDDQIHVVPLQIVVNK